MRPLFILILLFTVEKGYSQDPVLDFSKAKKKKIPQAQAHAHASQRFPFTTSVSYSGGLLSFPGSSGLNYNTTTRKHKYSYDNALSIQNRYHAFFTEFNLGLSNRFGHLSLFAGGSIFHQKKVFLNLALGYTYYNGREVTYYHSASLLRTAGSYDNKYIYFNRLGFKTELNLRLGSSWGINAFYQLGFIRLSQTQAYRYQPVKAQSMGISVFYDLRLQEKKDQEKSAAKQKNWQFMLGTGLQAGANNRFIAIDEDVELEQKAESFDLENNTHFSEASAYLLLEASIHYRKRFFIGLGYLLPLIAGDNHNNEQRSVPAYFEGNYVKVNTLQFHKLYADIGAKLVGWRKMHLQLSANLQYTGQSRYITYRSMSNTYHTSWNNDYTAYTFDLGPKLSWGIQLSRVCIDLYYIHPLYTHSQITYSYNREHRPDNATVYNYANEGGLSTTEKGTRTLIQAGIKISFALGNNP